jgi:hypothetical protein
MVEESFDDKDEGEFVVQVPSEVHTVDEKKLLEIA